MTRTVVKNGQLEFINGGWCMHDEASPYYTAMVDQTTRGHMFLKANFGIDAIPRGTWQIDPFGHSNTNAWLIGAEAGMQSLYWGRTDFQDLDMRKNHTKPHDQWPEWVWQGSASLGKSAQVFAGELGGGGYGAPIPGFDGGEQQIQDDPRRHDYNLDAWMDVIVTAARGQAEFTKTSQQMWAMGSDFNYQNADHWYHNMDKIVHYANLNGSINVFYSTPTKYTQAKYDETIKKKLTWEVRTDDMFPLGDNYHNYWSGYFTSRPALKKQVRRATNFLEAARQMEVVGKPSKVDLATARPSPVVGNSFTDSLEGTIGVATHHDGMSGTERQDVANDYEQRIAESHIEAEEGVARALSKLIGGEGHHIAHCNCNGKAGAIAGDCLNISMCAVLTGKEHFEVIGWNSRAHAAAEVMHIPVTGADWEVKNHDGDAVECDVIALTARDYELPLLYLHYSELQNASLVDSVSNKATHVLHFTQAMPPVGYSVFSVSKKAAAAASTAAVAKVEPAGSYTNGYYTVTLADGMVSHITNHAENISMPFAIKWGWYNASVGGCTEGLEAPAPNCSNQASGAYMFRPNSSNFYYPGEQTAPTVEVVEGKLVTEIRQTFSDWATHVIRLYKDAKFIEVEWTAGPIPMGQDWMDQPGHWGKEVVVKYSTGVASERTFYTDSNGREMIKRVRDARGPSYPPLVVSEPIAGNYYPVNAMIAVEDAKSKFVVLTDVTQGGSSMANGEVELMVHRRLQHDDSRGVQEPLNETMCGCNDLNAAPGQMGEHGHEGDGGCDCAGLTVRGKHWLILSTPTEANLIARTVNEELQYPATVAFNLNGTVERPLFTAIEEALPPNVKMMTLTNNYETLFDGGSMLRLAHLFSVDEHPSLSKPVNISIAGIFAKSGLKVASVTEMSLTGNMPLAEVDASKLHWPTQTPVGWTGSENAEETRRLMDPDDASFTIFLRPMVCLDLGLILTDSRTFLGAIPARRTPHDRRLFVSTRVAY